MGIKTAKRRAGVLEEFFRGTGQKLRNGKGTKGAPQHVNRPQEPTQHLQGLVERLKRNAQHTKQ